MQCLNVLAYEFPKNVYFIELLEDHRIPTNIDINEKTVDWKIRSKWNKFEVYM